ncbi:MAG TPA: VOC family protein [Phycisphaerales bacterium]|nr:VOC family protein [Phycisphaerales bacterium]
MITGAHAILYCEDAEKARAFLRDVLKFEHVDAGHGWLIFALPPAEVACHPLEAGQKPSHELYFMCEDITAATTELKARGVEFTMEPSDQGWGVLARFKVPGGGEIGIYQPRHPRPKHR